MSAPRVLVSKAPDDPEAKANWARLMARVQYTLWIKDGAKCARCGKPYASVNDFEARNPRVGNPKVFAEMFIDDACWDASSKNLFTTSGAGGDIK